MNCKEIGEGDQVIENDLEKFSRKFSLSHINEIDS